MNNKSVKITIRYIFSMIAVVAVVLVLNYAAFLFIIRDNPVINEPVNTVGRIADELLRSGCPLSKNTTQMLEKNHLWVQLINPDGQVIYQYNQPENSPASYSLKDIAGLSRSYLGDYPVYLWESGANMVLLGYPKNSIDKYSWSIPTYTYHDLPMTWIIIIALNLLITLGLAVILSRRITRPLGSILKGIASLSEEKEVQIKEKGLFKDVAESLTHTSGIILEKNRKLKLRDTAVSNWMTGISHDIRTPLSMILGYSTLIQEQASHSGEVHTQAGIITENALRIRSLVADLNLATSLKYQLLPVALFPVKIGYVVRKAVTECMNTGILHKCTMEVVIQDENTQALLDETLITRAIINLVGNSAKHNPAGCAICAEVPKPEDASFVSIILTDNGNGMPEGILEELEKRENAAWGNSTHGLGLVIVKSIMEAHHGMMTIKSKKGKGSSVILKIPGNR